MSATGRPRASERRRLTPGSSLVTLAPRENDRLRLDLLKAEADRYPTRYRAYVEAYLRSLNGPRR